MSINSSNQSPFQGPLPSNLRPSQFSTRMNQHPVASSFSQSPNNLSLQINIDQQPAFEKKELIQSYSQLNRFSEKRFFYSISQNDEKILANMCLSPASKGSSLEGVSTKVILRHFDEILDFVDKGKGLFVDRDGLQLVRNTTKQLICEVSESCNKTPQEQTKRLTEDLLALDSGESLSISSGSLKTGEEHFMIIRFIRNADQSFDVKVYNAQSGCEQIVGGSKSLHKTKVFPYLEFTNVTPEKLFFDDSLILLNIFKIKQVHLTKEVDDTHTIYSYFAPIMDCLDPNHVKNRGVSHFISAQRSGNCTIKSFNCLVLDMLNDTKQYKLLVLENRFYTIQKFYHQLEKDKNDFATKGIQDSKHQNIFLLRQSVMSFLRMMNRCEGLMSQEKYLSGVATALDILEHLDEIQRLSPDYKEVRGEPTTIKHLASEKAMRLITIKKVRNKLIAPPVANQIRKNAYVWDCHIGQGGTWNNLEKNLNLILKSNDLPHNEYLIQFQTFMYNIKHLKNDIDELSKMSLRKSKVLMRNLDSILTTAINIQTEKEKQLSKNKGNLLPSPLSNPSFQNSIMEVLAISFQLACHVDDIRKWGKHPGAFRKLGLWTDYFQQESRKEGFDITDPLVLNHRNDLLDFFVKLNKASSNCDHSQSISEQHPIERTAEGEYLLLVVPKFSAESPKTGDAALRYALEQKEYLYSLYHKKDKKDSNRKDAELNSELEHWYIFRDLSEKCYSTTSGQKIKYFKGLPESNYLEHLEDNLQSENNLLTHFVRNQKIPPARLCYQIEKSDCLFSLAKPDLTVMVLMDEIIKNPERLLDSSERSMILHFFHKTLDRDQKTTSPLFNTIENDPFFLDRLNELQDAICFALNRADKKPEQMSGLLFIYQLNAMCLCSYSVLKGDKDSKQARIDLKTKTLERIEELLKIPSLKDQHRKHFLYIKVSLLIDLHKWDNHSNLGSQIFFIMSTINAIPEITETPFFEEQVLRDYYNFLPKLMQEVNNQPQEFVKEVFCYLGLNQEIPFIVSEKDGIISIDILPDKWTLDLKLQKIFFNNELMGKSKDWKQGDGFDRLFPEGIHSFEQFGKEIVFSHKIWGQIRLLLDYNLNVTKIEKKIRGQWYVYSSPIVIDPVKASGHTKDSFDGIFSNHALSYDYVHWIAPESSLDNNQVVICDYKSGKETHVVTKSGELKSLVNKGKFSKKGLDENSAKSIFESYEDAQQITVWEGKKKIVEFNRCNRSVR